MISFLVPARVQNNPNSNIHRFLTTLKDSLDPKYYPLIEVIFKFDSDDNFIPTNDYLSKFPFVIKTCRFSSCDVGDSYDLFINYAFSLRNKSFKFVINSSDDFVFFRKNWIEDYFSMPNYCIVDSGFGSNGTRKPDKHNFETWDLNKLLNGQIQPKSYEPISSRIGDFSSSFTSNIIEIAGNFACLSDVNVWATILPGIIFNLFKVDIYRKIEPFSKRSTNLSTFTNDKMLPWGIIIKANEQNPITQSISTRNLGGVQGRKLQSPYHYKLVAQQARNIYLNMLEDKEA